MIATALISGLAATLAITLARAMYLHPDPAHLMPKPLNMVALAAMGWGSALITTVNAIYLFGLIRPLIAATAFYALYRLIVPMDLVPLYKYAIVIGILTLLITIYVTSQNTIQRSIP